MQIGKKILCLGVMLTTGAGLSAAGEKPKTAAAQVDPYAEVQPTTEKLDLLAYQKIRDEGLNHSHVMEFASALTDVIGPRLTGSENLKKANEWSRDTFTKLGLANAHLEDWGEFGMGWKQLNAWARLVTPDTGVLLVQATPWSPATPGAVTGEVVFVEIQGEKDLEKYKGKLTGKVVLFGAMREVAPLDKPLFTRYSDQELKETAEFPVSNEAGSTETRSASLRARAERGKLMDLVAKFFSDEKVATVIVPSRDGEAHGGAGLFFDDNGAALGRTPYLADKRVKIPVAVASIESYGRLYRLTQAHVPATVEINLDTKFTGEHEHAYNTVAEIPGTDPKLKDQVVMLGGHIDSWASATGATDDGAGTVVAMEAVRILKALGIEPRRTIRVALWSGEEQGIFGSRGYVTEHFGSAKTSTAPDQLELPEFLRRVDGALTLKAEQKLVSAYFNVDYGEGKARGIFTQNNVATAPIFAQWIEPLKDLGVTTISNRAVGGTDHLSFDAVGIPGFQFIQDPMDYSSRTHHSNQDTYERLQPADLRQLAIVEAIFVYNAAMRDQMMPRKPLPTPELEQKLRAPLEGVYPGAVATAQAQN